MKVYNIIFLLFLGTFFMFPGGVVAQETQDGEFEHPPLPGIEALPEKDFIDQTVQYSDKPFSDNALSYLVRLPKDWKKSENEGSGADMSLLSAKILSEAGRYYSPVSVISGFPSRFVINAVSLDYEMTAEQWFLQHLVSNGYALQGLEIFDEDRAEAIFVVLDGDTSYVVRATAIKNGKRIVLAQYYMPIEKWEEDKRMQVSAIRNFKLVSPDDALVEKMKLYHFLDIAEFQYPESWTLRAPPMRSVDRMNVQLLSIPPQTEEQKYLGQTVLDGKIEVYLTSVYVAKDLEAEAKRIASEVEDTGLILSADKKIDLAENIRSALVYQGTDIYKAQDKDSDLLTYEYWITKMKHGDYYYYATLLTPSQEEDFYVWSRNTETYKLLLNFMRPQDGSLISQ